MEAKQQTAALAMYNTLLRIVRMESETRLTRGTSRLLNEAMKMAEDAGLLEAAAEPAAPIVPAAPPVTPPAAKPIEPVPTLETVMGGGYTKEAAEAIVKREQERFDRETAKAAGK